MTEKKFIGTFQSEHEVLDKIDGLKIQGFSEDDIYVVTNDAESLSMVQARTDVDLRSSEGSWIDRFKAFITGDEPVLAAFTNMGFTEEESSRYYNVIKQGGILLYVDRDYDHAVHNVDMGVVNEDLDANLGSNLSVDYSVNQKDNPINAHNNLNANIEYEEHLNLQKKEVDVGRHTAQDEMATGEEFAPRKIVDTPITEEEIKSGKRPVIKEPFSH